jgi:hypothetical protein
MAWGERRVERNLEESEEREKSFLNPRKARVTPRRY